MENQNQHNVEQEKLPTNPHRIIKLSIVVLACTLGVFLIWAAFAPLNQGAGASGFVTVASYRKVVQHQYGGTVKQILVHEGDEVKKDQVLIKLEDSDIKAKFTSVQAEYIAALIVYARLQAERAFMPKIVYPPIVLEMKDVPEVKKLIAAQEELFRARKSKLEADKRILKETISGLKSYAINLEKQRKSYERQLEIVNKQISSLKSLTEEGYYPKNRFLDLERTAEDLKSKISETIANQQRAEASVQEYLMRISAIEREYLQNVETELAEVEKKLPSLRDSYNALKDMLEKTEIKAPVDGTVMALRVHTEGGVISPGQPIMEIVPKNSQLIVEAKLSPAHIEDVKKGQKADLHFIALDPKKTPIIEGEVIYISPDLMIDEQSKTPYYLVRVKIEESSYEKIRKLNKEIVPGMPVQVVIKTGSRTFLSYLLKPFLDRLALSFLK